MLKWNIEYRDSATLEYIDAGEPINFNPLRLSKDIPTNGLISIGEKSYIIKNNVRKHELDKKDAIELYSKLCTESFKNIHLSK